MSLLKSVLLFLTNQVIWFISCGIFCSNFFQEFTSIIPFMAWFQDSCQIKGRQGSAIDISLVCLTNVLIFSLWFFKVVKIFHVLIILCSLKTYCCILLYILFALGIGRFFTVYICFKEILFFSFSYKLIFLLTSEHLLI